ncbi:MAG: hypothetical protein WBM40_12560, partial [Thiohalocapsa sp.]
MTDDVLFLARSAAAWNSPAFRPTLIEEVQALGPEHASLQPLLQAGLAPDERSGRRRTRGPPAQQPRTGWPR